MLSKITHHINLHGPVTCQTLADQLGHKPCDVIPVLRRGVEIRVLDEISGFYRVDDLKNTPRRKSYPWVEGKTITHDVIMLALDVQGNHSLTVVVELDRASRKKGHPPFLVATLNTEQCHFTSSITGDFITDHVVRYMPLDTHIVRPL